MSTNVSQEVQNLGEQPFYDAFIDCSVQPKAAEDIIPIQAVILEDRLIAFNGEEYEAVDHKLFILNALLAYRGAGFSRLRPLELKKPAENILFDPFARSSAEQTSTFSTQIGLLIKDLSRPDDDFFIIEKDGHRSNTRYSLNAGLVVTDARPKNSKRLRPLIIPPNQSETPSQRGRVHILASTSGWYKGSDRFVQVTPLREVADSSEVTTHEIPTPEHRNAVEPKEYKFAIDSETLTVRFTPAQFAKLNIKTKLIFAYSQIPAAGLASHKLIDSLMDVVNTGLPATASRTQRALVTKLHNDSVKGDIVKIDEQSGAATLLEKAKTQLIKNNIAARRDFVANTEKAPHELSPTELIQQSKAYLDQAIKLAEKIPGADLRAFRQLARTYNKDGFESYNQKQLVFLHTMLKREATKLHQAKQARRKEAVIKSLVNGAGEPLYGSAD